MRLAQEGEVATLVIHRDYESNWGLQVFSLGLGSHVLSQKTPTHPAHDRKEEFADYASLGDYTNRL